MKRFISILIFLTFSIITLGSNAFCEPLGIDILSASYHIWGFISGYQGNTDGTYQNLYYDYDDSSALPLTNAVFVGYVV